MEVSVRSPFPFEALPRVWRWIQAFRHKVADDFLPKTLDAYIEMVTSHWSKQKTWAIYADGELGGLISFERLNPWTGSAHLLLKPAFQGRGMAMKALRQTFQEMFAEGVGRLIFHVIAGNLAVGSLVVNLGGRREGCLRGHTLQDGKPTDVWVYGLLKTEFEGKLNAISVRVDEDHQQQHDADTDCSRLGSVQSAE